MSSSLTERQEPCKAAKQCSEVELICENSDSPTVIARDIISTHRSSLTSLLCFLATITTLRTMNQACLLIMCLSRVSSSLSSFTCTYLSRCVCLCGCRLTPSTSAPLSINFCTQYLLPPRADECSAVCPARSRTSTGVPSFTKHARDSVFPLPAQQLNTSTATKQLSYQRTNRATSTATELPAQQLSYQHSNSIKQSHNVQQQRAVVP